MSYASTDDMIAAFPERDLVQLTNENPNAPTVNTDKLQVYLDESSALIDSYLESRFALPLPLPDGVPVVLKKICRDLAMYGLQALRPLHDVEDARNRQKDALSMLREIRDGKLTLGLTAAGAEPTIASPTVMTAPASSQFSSVFTRETLKVW